MRARRLPGPLLRQAPHPSCVGRCVSSFEALGRSLGLPYTAFVDTPAGYHIGLLSRFPIAVLEARSGSPFHHGVLVVQVRGLPSGSTALACNLGTAAVSFRRRSVASGWR